MVVRPLANVPPDVAVAKCWKYGIVALPVFNLLFVSMSFPSMLCRAFKLERNEQAYTVRGSRRSERSVRPERRRETYDSR